MEPLKLFFLVMALAAIVRTVELVKQIRVLRAQNVIAGGARNSNNVLSQEEK